MKSKKEEKELTAASAASSAKVTTFSAVRARMDRAVDRAVDYIEKKRDTAPSPRLSVDGQPDSVVLERA